MGTTKQCCRYNFDLIKKTSVSEILNKNTWLFEDSWMLWSCFSELENIQLPEAATNPIVNDHFIQFSNEKHDFKTWQDLIDWDLYGTWFVYTFPVNRPLIRKTMLLCHTSSLSIKEENDYSSISREWKFIHDIYPDIFISKRKEDILIGAHDSYYSWLIKRNMSCS